MSDRRNIFTKIRRKTKSQYDINETPTAVSIFDVFTDIHSSVSIEKGKAKLFQLNGNPLIFGGAVKEVHGNPAVGDEVLVKDHFGNTFGRGLYNPNSLYRIRLMALLHEPAFKLSLSDLIKLRIANAKRLREAMQLPSKETNAYRLINGEGDRLGGLIIDVLGKTVVIQSSAIWVETHAKLVMDAVNSQIDKKSFIILWRRSENRLKQDGYVNSQIEELENGHERVSANATEKSSKSENFEIIKENNVLYKLYPESDQKTGFYCDQRENRNLIKKISEGKTVLDTYCYSGGFSLNAIMGGAISVIAIDSSEKAIGTANDNRILNKISEEKVQFIHGDCIAEMESMVKEKKFFDIVICDPPKLAPTRDNLEKASMKYKKINALAISLVHPMEGGHVLTCTCSAAMTQADGNFLRVIHDAARSANRDVTILSKTGAAGDHTIIPGYREGEYLTAVLLYVHSLVTIE